MHIKYNKYFLAILFKDKVKHVVITIGWFGFICLLILLLTSLRKAYHNNLYEHVNYKGACEFFLFCHSLHVEGVYLSNINTIDFLRFCFVSGDGGRRCFLTGALGLLIGIGGNVSCVTRPGVDDMLGLSGNTSMMEDVCWWIFTCCNCSTTFIQFIKVLSTEQGQARTRLKYRRNAMKERQHSRYILL